MVDTPPVVDTPPALRIIGRDTTRRVNLNDSLQTIQTTDTFLLKLSKDTLDAPVKYQAEDSVVILVQEKKIILYGKTQTDYKDITLKAPKVELDQQTQVLTAVNSKDSLGIVLENANFKQGENEFFSDTIRFNFKTQKGLTKNTITQQGEIFVHGEQVKKVDASTTFVKKGMFTTCNLDEPHFAFKTNRLKVINQKLAVSGPTHPEFEGVPVPVYLPFGYFPLSQGRHSGLIAPTLEVSEQMGVGLVNGGYYKVFNDYWDLELRGDLYSYGSWRLNARPTYRKRYRYSGAFNLSVQNIRQDFKGDPQYSSSKSYFLTWNHSVDPRIRPGTTFTANVNAGSTKYNQFIPNDPRRNFQNQLGSSIAYSKTWKDSPFNLTLSANHNQNNATRLISVTIPDAGFTMSTIYPFQRKEFVGAAKWYEKLGIGYNGTFRNQVSFYDTAFRFKDLIDTLQWGAQHNVPITVSLPALFNGALVVSPSVSYAQVWIAQKFRRQWNTATQKVDTIITKGFFTDHTTQFSIGLNTAVFGTYTFKNSRIIAIRHVMRPSLSLNYKPDLSRRHYYTDTVRPGVTERFSEFQGALYSGYSEGRTGGMSFQLDNNLEMKWRSRKDSGENAIKKIRLIDGYGFSTGYNFLRDSLKLDPFNLYFRANIFEKINISANAVLNPYLSDTLGRDINKYAWSGGKFSPGRITTGSISVSTSFQSKPKDPKKAEEQQKQIRENLNSPELRDDQQRLLEYARQNPSEFVDFNVPWNVSLSYSLYFTERRKSDYTGFEKDFSSNISFNGGFNLTPKWNFSMNGYYDFDTRQIQTFSMAITREMHCWQMSISVTPVGLYRFFNISISPKASVLQDLRINRTRSFNSY
ncbi:MAG TPA: putative LPS assembly protein LptD [Chitinophagaceae bacterium]|nr:putative LPS assembly protein LptD [Chitinophagaceae bacterium]